MGPTWTRYTHGSACAYRMTTARSGAIDRPGITTQACSVPGHPASSRPGHQASTTPYCGPASWEAR